MPRAGGESEKLGASFESVWTVRSMLDLLIGRIQTISIEPLIDAEGIEFVTTASGGLRFFHSVKRQKTGGDWSMYDLTTSGKTGKRSILGDLVERMRASHKNNAVFASSTGANDLRELTERASRSLDLDAFEANLSSSSKLARRHEEYVLPLFDNDAEAALDGLRRLEVILINEVELVRVVDDRCAFLLRPASGANGDSWHSTIRLHLADIALQRLGQVLKKEQVLDEMRVRGWTGATSQPEALASATITATPAPLSLDTAADVDVEGASRLLFWTREIGFAGREEELRELHDFAHDERRLLWWLWCGAGGTGKSRLALEFALQLEARGWHTGFLPSTGRLESLPGWQPSQPTLIVVDYCGSRPREVGELISTLASSQLRHLLRLLLLEREQSGPWWSDLVHAHNSAERRRIARCQYKQPSELLPLEDGDLWRVAQSVFESNHHSPSIEVDEFVAELRSIDPIGRPLFAALAADAICHGARLRRWNQGELIGDVLTRELRRWRETLRAQVSTEAAEEQYLNLMAVATILGGLTVEEIPNLLSAHVLGLLPRVDAFQIGTYAELLPSKGKAHLAPLEPDLLGEVFVLERLGDDRTSHWGWLIELSWNTRAQATAVFLARVGTDFPAHSSLDRLLAAPAEPNQRIRFWWSAAVVSCASSLAQENPSLLNALMQQLESWLSAHPDETILQQHLGLALLEAATQLLQVGDASRARDLLASALSLKRIPIELEGELRYHDGLAQFEIGSRAEAARKFEQVQRSPRARADTRARGLHNLAAVCLRLGDTSEALEHLTALGEADWAPPSYRLDAVTFGQAIASPSGEQPFELSLHGPSPGYFESGRPADFVEFSAGFEHWYDELQGIAKRIASRATGGLEPDELVHECYLSMMRYTSEGAVDRERFLALASLSMRRVLIDRSRRRMRAKEERPALAIDAEIQSDPTLVIEIDEALRALAKLDQRKSDIVELRIFGGLTTREIADLMQLSPRTVDSDWSFALSWLQHHLREPSD